MIVAISTTNQITRLLDQLHVQLRQCLALVTVYLSTLQFCGYFSVRLRLSLVFRVPLVTVFPI